MTRVSIRKLDFGPDTEDPADGKPRGTSSDARSPLGVSNGRRSPQTAQPLFSAALRPPAVLTPVSPDGAPDDASPAMVCSTFFSPLSDGLDPRAFASAVGALRTSSLPAFSGTESSGDDNDEPADGSSDWDGADGSELALSSVNPSPLAAQAAVIARLRSTEGSAHAAAAIVQRGVQGSGPCLLDEQTIVLEGWVTKYSDHLGLPRRRWLVLCDHRVYAYADAHGYLRSPPHSAATGSGRGPESIGGRPTMALDLRQCALLSVDVTPDEILLVTVHGERKRICFGNSRERQLWLLALTQASCRVSGSAWAELAAPPPDDGGVERHLLHTPVGYVHYVTVAPAAAGQAAGSAPARLSDGSVGAPLLCVHGSGGSSKEFARVVAQLSARGRRVVALDLPGCGASDRVQRAQQAASSQALADALAGDTSTLCERPSSDSIALMALSVHVGARAQPAARARRRAAARGEAADASAADGRVCLLGSGFLGGLVCLSFAAAHPERVSALVLADCAAPRGSAELLRALSRAVACGVLVVWAARSLADVRAPTLGEPSLVGESELSALRSFAYCAQLALDEPREGALPVGDVDASQHGRTSAWADAVLDHLARFD